jgi:hypothetical protein
MAEALAKGTRVLFREGRFEQVGTVLDVRADGMVVVGMKMARIGSAERPAGTWDTKLVPSKELSVLPVE